MLGYGAYRSETEAMEACIYGVPLKEVSNVFTFLCSAFRNYDVVYSIHPGYIAKTTKEEFLQMVDLALKINPILHEKNISSQPEQ